MLNPFDSQQSSVESRPTDKATSDGVPISIAWRLCVLAIGTVLTGVSILLQWCVLDYVTVRVLRYPDDLGTYDWTFLGSPILPLVILLLFRWVSPKTWTPKRLLAMTIIGWLLAIP